MGDHNKLMLEKQAMNWVFLPTLWVRCDDQREHYTGQKQHPWQHHDTADTPPVATTLFMLSFASKYYVRDILYSAHLNVEI